MKKRVFIIYGWDGHPGEGWLPWLKKELQDRNFDVFIPELLNSDEPRIKSWIPAISKAVENPDENTYFIGHSMGCQAIARYLEGFSDKTKIGGAVFVAGFFKKLSNLEDDEIVRRVADEWLNTPLNLEKVKTHLNKSVAIFSDDDPYVPIDNQAEFRDVLGSEIIIEKNMGHFSESNGIMELPVVLKAILELSPNPSTVEI